MIDKKYLTKKTKTTRTYRYKVENSNGSLDARFTKIQRIRITYFNYGLKYLYQHYGIGHLSVYFPKLVSQRNYIIKEMKQFARDRLLKLHNYDLKQNDYSVQSIDKMLMELIIAFDKYRKNQFKVNRWSESQKKKYLMKHNCNLTGYGRINYKHNLNDIHSVTFKQQIHRDKNTKQLNFWAIKLINNYTVKIPCFGDIHTKESLTAFKNKEIAEVTILKRDNGDYELQLKYKFKKQKHLKHQVLDNVTGLDVNSANNELYAFSDGNVDGLPVALIKRLKLLDKKQRNYQHYLDVHNHNRANKYYQIKHRQDKIKAKISNLITWQQWLLAKKYAKEYPVLAMEKLCSFTMRVSKRLKDKYKRKNINHKLALVKPATFKAQMINAFENYGSLLVTVNPFYTSKQCSICGWINKDLRVGQKHWLCQNCGIMHHRDHNSTVDIVYFAEHPEKHPILKYQDNNNLTVDDVVEFY